jgi:hypothetical protein
MPDLTEFTVGPPEPVTDSRRLPVITPQDEGGFVSGADLEVHPDNDGVVDDATLAALLAAATPEQQQEAEAAAGAEPSTLPDDTELDAVVADVDTDAVDPAGFGAEEEGFVGLDSVDDPQPQTAGGGGR